MKINDAILAIVSTSGKVEGRKRLQKMVHLVKQSGADIPVAFRIHHYGPFSEDVANSAEMMVFEGELEEDIEKAGPYDTFQYLYSTKRTPSVSSKLREMIMKLNQYSTVELEVASTIAFFQAEGLDHDKAVEQAKVLKPKKTTSRVLGRSEEILQLVGAR
ncbi:MAG: hypothetical protein AMXMBFR67_24680 [Nitrospira sp.]